LKQNRRGAAFGASPFLRVNSIAAANGLITLTLTDAVAQASFTASTNLDLPGAVGANTAYVGIAGACGSTVSTQSSRSPQVSEQGRGLT
jgi:hypothetical protein